LSRTLVRPGCDLSGRGRWYWKRRFHQRPLSPTPSTTRPSNPIGTVKSGVFATLSRFRANLRCGIALPSSCSR